MPEPVSTALAKQQIGLLDDTSRDALIDGYSTAARIWVENYTGHILVRRQVTETHAGFGSFFDLRWRPYDPETVQIAYTDADGAAQTVSDFTFAGQRVRPAYNAWWPTTRRGSGITLSYTAGYADGEVPQPLVQAILLLVAHWFENREAGANGAMTEAPFAVTSLCDQYRMPGL